MFSTSYNHLRNCVCHSRHDYISYAKHMEFCDEYMVGFDYNINEHDIHVMVATSNRNMKREV